jgi:hypothetical protein
MTTPSRQPIRVLIVDDRLLIGTLSGITPECCPPSVRNRVRHGAERALLPLEPFIKTFGQTQSALKDRCIKRIIVTPRLVCGWNIAPRRRRVPTGIEFLSDQLPRHLRY